MKCKLVVAVVLNVILLTGVSASELTIPESFDFLAVDGKDVGGWSGSSRTIELTAGEHRIALEYSAAVEGANPRTQEFVSSDPLLITLIVEPGKRYRLVPHSSAKTSPRAFSENPKMKIMSGNDDAQADIAMLVQNRQSRWAKITQASNVSTQPSVSDMAQVTGKSSRVMIDNIGGTPAASMLVYWWNEADQQTRDNFLQQLNK